MRIISAARTGRRPLVRLLWFWSICLVAAVVVSLVGTPARASAASRAGHSAAEAKSIGPYAVGFTLYTITDPTRPVEGSGQPRPVPVYVWYPVNPGVAARSAPVQYPEDPFDPATTLIPSATFEQLGAAPAYEKPAASRAHPFPLLVFSHGYQCFPLVHLYLATRLASHGYVVAMPYHYGDGVFEEPRPSNMMAQLFNRPFDLRLVLDDLLRRSSRASTDPLHGLIDSSRIAAGGYSLGGYGALVWAGGVADFGEILEHPVAPGWMTPLGAGPWCGTGFTADRRVKALVLHDASSWALNRADLLKVRVPALSVGEEWSTLARAGLPWWLARQHAALAGDCTAAGTGVVPSQATVNGILQEYTLAFLDTGLIGRRGYARILTPRWALTRERYTEFFVAEKVPARAMKGEGLDLSYYFHHQPGHRHPGSAARGRPLTAAEVRSPFLGLPAGGVTLPARERAAPRGPAVSLSRHSGLDSSGTIKA